jgi:D-glycerate 3-kinase
MTSSNPDLLASVAQWLAEGGGVLAMSGPQGAGKSTLCKTFAAHAGADVLVLALDDFYLNRAERAQLAARVSPLFAVRGPPGTHDVARLVDVIGRLRAGDVGVRIPRFDKRNDDREPPEADRVTVAPVRVVVLEGWCVGARAPDDFVTSAALNAVERGDRDGAWRAAQAAALRGPYAHIWGGIDRFAHLQAPGFESVQAWRTQQEADNQGVPLSHLSEERRAFVAHFIQHYERLTRAMARGWRAPGAWFQLDATRALVERGLDPGV